MSSVGSSSSDAFSSEMGPYLSEHGFLCDGSFDLPSLLFPDTESGRPHPVKRARSSSKRAPEAKVHCRDASTGVERIIQNLSIGTPMKMRAICNLYHRKKLADSKSVELIRSAVSKLHDNYMSALEAIDLLVQAKATSSDCQKSNQLLDMSIELLQNSEVEQDIKKVFEFILTAGKTALDSCDSLLLLAMKSKIVSKELSAYIT